MMRHYKKSDCLFCAILIGAVSLFLTAFTFPQLPDIKKTLQEKWQLLISKTPGAKELQQWRTVYAETKQIMQNAKDMGVVDYAPEKLQRAEDTLTLAIRYAKQKYYQKAIEYAQKAKEDAESAISDTQSAKLAKEQQLRKVLKEMESLVLQNAQGQHHNLTKNKQDEAKLYLSDIHHAILLEQFDDAGLMLEVLRKEFMN